MLEKSLNPVRWTIFSSAKKDIHIQKVSLDPIPDIDREERRLHPIDGLMPDPVDLPEGCKFHPDALAHGNMPN